MTRPPVTVVTPPAAEPVTRAELVAQLRLNDATGIEAELDRAIKTAREIFEASTGRAVLPTTFRQHEDGWPADGFRLQRWPVLSFTSVRYFPLAGGVDVEQAGFELDNSDCPAVVYHPDAAAPAPSRKVRRPVRVTFVAGWATAADVPAAVKTAVLLYAAELYESAFAVRQVPDGWGRVVDLYRTGLEWAA